jgi:hypothetical protein
VAQVQGRGGIPWVDLGRFNLFKTVHLRRPGLLVDEIRQKKSDLIGLVFAHFGGSYL